MVPLLKQVFLYPIFFAILFWMEQFNSTENKSISANKYFNLKTLNFRFKTQLNIFQLNRIYKK